MTYPPLPPVPKPPEPTLDVPSLLAGSWARELILDVALTQPRSLQAHLGPSEIGQVCERRLAYRVLDAPYVNIADPLASLIGTGFHEVMAAGLRPNPRYLVEIDVSYRGITGRIDLYDMVTHRLADWKMPALKRLRRTRREGLGVNYRVQLAIYAEALRAMGYEVDQTVCVFVPRDAEPRKALEEIYAWVGPPDKALADEYIDRYHRIAEQARAGGAAALPVTPTPLCDWCPNYQPRAVDLTHACPGVKEAA